VSARYLLPCNCGQQIVVGPPQAGETIVCRCGAQLDVPTMLEMTMLCPVPAQESRPSDDKAWGSRQRMLLIGVVLLAAAMALGVLLYRNRPISPFENVDPEYIKLAAHQFSPWQTWDTWDKMKHGLDQRVDEPFIRARWIYRLGQGLTVALGLLGTGLIAGGLAPSRSSRPSAPPREG
jgi:hypothetical protein